MFGKQRLLRIISRSRASMSHKRVHVLVFDESVPDLHSQPLNTGLNAGAAEPGRPPHNLVVLTQ